MSASILNGPETPELGVEQEAVGQNITHERRLVMFGGRRERGHEEQAQAPAHSRPHPPPPGNDGRTTRRAKAGSVRLLYLHR